jgi:hypothetical protein
MEFRRRIRLGAAIAATVALGLGAVAVDRVDMSTGERPSGIRGHVTRGCNDEQKYPELCAQRPLAASQQILRRIGGAEGRLVFVMRFRSSRDGSFEVELPPGNYLVEPTPGQRGIGAVLHPVTIEVRESEFTSIDLYYQIGLY